MPIRILTASLLAALAVSGPETSRACAEWKCQCIAARDRHRSEAEVVRAQRDRSERVVLGRVTRIDTLAAERMMGPMGDSIPIRQIVARVHVERVWRGPLTDTLIVRFHTVEWPFSCDLALESNSRYVIFAYRLERQWLITQQCSGTIAAQNARATLRALGEGKPSQP